MRAILLLAGLPAAATATASIADPTLSINGISFATRAYWMRLANEAVAELSGSPCPFAAFGSVIVNHTNNDGLGDLVCIGANENSQTGNPSLHGKFYSIDWQGYRPVNGYGVGEIAAIKNCTAVLTDPHGRFRLSPSAAESAFADLTLYTNAESCPMCASAIRWSGFREYVYGTSINTLIEQGWGQIRVASIDIFQASFDLPYQSRLMGNVLTNETDPYFLWQYNPGYPCPKGCSRSQDGMSCKKSTASNKI